MMYMRVLTGAAALAVAASSQGAISVSFASDSANVERIFELSSEAGPLLGGSPLTIRTIENVEVDLLVSSEGADLGLTSQRVGFEAEFMVMNGSGAEGVNPGQPFVFSGELNGAFRFFDLGNPSETILAGSVGNGVGVFAGMGSIFGGAAPQFLTGSLLGPMTEFSTEDGGEGVIPAGMFGDAAFTVTNFAEMFMEGGPVARAGGSFSGTFIPSTGTGVLAALALGVGATRRRR